MTNASVIKESEKCQLSANPISLVWWACNGSNQLAPGCWSLFLCHKFACLVFWTQFAAIEKASGMLWMVLPTSMVPKLRKFFHTWPPTLWGYLRSQGVFKMTLSMSTAVCHCNCNKYWVSVKSFAVNCNFFEVDCNPFEVECKWHIMTFYCECSHWFCCLIQILVWTILSSGQQLQRSSWLQIPTADVSLAVNTSILQLTSTQCVNPFISALSPPFALYLFVSQHIHVAYCTMKYNYKYNCSLAILNHTKGIRVVSGEKSRVVCQMTFLPGLRRQLWGQVALHLNHTTFRALTIICRKVRVELLVDCTSCVTCEDAVGVSEG